MNIIQQLKQSGLTHYTPNSYGNGFIMFSQSPCDRCGEMAADANSISLIATAGMLRKHFEFAQCLPPEVAANDSGDYSCDRCFGSVNGDLSLPPANGTTGKF